MPILRLDLIILKKGKGRVNYFYLCGQLKLYEKVILLDFGLYVFGKL